VNAAIEISAGRPRIRFEAGGVVRISSPTDTKFAEVAIDRPVTAP
jgi:hypothetical protein